MDNDLVYVKSICLFVDKNIVRLRKRFTLKFSDMKKK